MKQHRFLGIASLRPFSGLSCHRLLKESSSITNEVITLVKDTSLAFVVSVAEMFTIAKQIASAQTTMTPFLVAAIFYYIFNLIVAVAMNKIEKMMNYYK